MSEDGNHDLDPIDPSTAQQLYLDHKASQAMEKTVQGHRYRTNHFVRWCDEKEIDNMNDLTGRHIHEYRLWRKEDGNLNAVSLQTQMSTIRVFLRWCGSIEAVDPNLYTKVMVPQVPPEEQQRDELLEKDRAEEILSYLSNFSYASIEHVLLALLWETGIRIGAAKSLDLQDVDLEDEFLRFSHRPETGTPLKNGTGGERLVAISPGLAVLLEDYIENTRPNQTDDAGREPLLTSRQGRLSRSSMRRYVYNITAPCFLDEECPDCAESTDAKCPEAVTPHAVRRGSITHFLTKDVPTEVVGDRMDVSRKILDKHYDRRSEEVKLEQRRSYLESAKLDSIKSDYDTKPERR